MRVALLFLAIACGEDDVKEVEEDEVIDTGDDRPESAADCEELSLAIDGPEPPRVDDSWTVWMWCDGALLTGTMVMRFDPPDVAEVHDNVATFLEPGTAMMRFQVGSRRVDQEVSVEP
jgi:hypothetical protein